MINTFGKDKASNNMGFGLNMISFLSMNLEIF